MNTAVNVNVVHESEAQRQHARYAFPPSCGSWTPSARSTKSRSKTFLPAA